MEKLNLFERGLSRWTWNFYETTPAGCQSANGTWKLWISCPTPVLLGHTASSSPKEDQQSFLTRILSCILLIRLIVRQTSNFTETFQDEHNNGLKSEKLLSEMPNYQQNDSKVNTQIRTFG